MMMQHHLFTALLLTVLLTPASVHAFGSKRISHLVDADDWSKSVKTLLNGSYDDGHGARKIAPETLGSLQAGPYLEQDSKERATLLVTLIDGDKCLMLRKPLQQIDHPELTTQLKKVSCEKGGELRAEAVIPKIPGYATLSDEGMRQLTALSDVNWRMSRDCFLNGSEEDKIAFTQRFKFIFMEDSKQVDIYSQGHAFSTRETYVSREWRIHPIQILRMLEQKNPGGIYRFLIWGNRFGLATDEENRMRIAAVNPVLMNAKAQLMLFGGDKICIGERCQRTSTLEFTNYIAFHYLVMEFDPADSTHLKLTMFQVDGDHPTVEFRYSR